MVNRSSKFQIMMIALGGIFMAASYTPERMRVVDSRSFKSDSQILRIGKIDQVCEAINTPNGVLRAKVIVQTKDLRDYQNVFQTSALNMGLRLEINQAGSTAIIIGSPTSDGIVASELKGPLLPNESAVLEIEVSQKYGATIMRANDQSPKVMVPIKGINPSCDAVLVGSGFDSTRNFSGKVDVELTFGKWTQVFPIPDGGRNLGQLLVILGAFHWAIGDTYRMKSKRANIDNSKEGGR